MNSMYDKPTNEQIVDLLKSIDTTLKKIELSVEKSTKYSEESVLFLRKQMGKMGISQ